MKKKRIIFISVISIIALVSLILYYFNLPPFHEIGDPPVEPEPFASLNQEDNYLKLKYYPSPEIQVYDFSMDRRGNYILFGSNTKKVTLIDGEGRLKWEKTFENDPLQTKITSCGSYIGIGTSGGAVLLMKEDQEVIWEKDLEKPVTQLVLSSKGRWIIIGSGNDEGENKVTFFDQETEEEWSYETGKLINLRLSSDERLIIFTEKLDNIFNTVALDLKGKEIWTIAQSELKALSVSGELLAVQDENNDLVVYNHKKVEQWRNSLSPNSFRALFNTQSNRLLVYDQHSKNDDNFYYFSPDGDVMWQNFIEEDALITFSSDGKRIIYSSGKHHKDAFSKIIVLNEEGDITRELEVTVQVEKIIAAENADQIFLAGNDGSVYQVDLTAVDKQE